MAAFAAVAVLMSWVPHASAQSRPDPADPSARVPTAAYRSPFADYRVLGDEAVGNWRAANDEVGRIGGWREYAREVQDTGSKPVATPPKPAPNAPPPGGHGAHGKPEAKQ
jgi:hypothetical protein